MPRDPRAIISPSFRAKLSQLKGLGPEEKALFQRIGNLVDVLHFTQRQQANPRGQRRIVASNVPKPDGVAIVGITGGIQISWLPVDVPSLSFYEVEISETSTFAVAETFNVLNTRMSFRSQPASGSVFVRIRSVTKTGQVSNWTATSSSSVGGSTVFSTDQDFIEPENRTTVSPKPTLLGTPTNLSVGNIAFTGIGAYVGPSPLTLDDTNYDANVQIRNEISYTLYEEAAPYPGIEQFLAPTIGEYIDEDGFYTYDESFYMRFATLPGSFSDYFTTASLVLTPSTLDVEFLRYRLIGSFYSPQMNQAGYVLNASLSTLRF